MSESNEMLALAAQALLDRWDTPAWKDMPATASYINALRAALRSIPSRPDAGERVPLADHDEIGRKVLGQPWAIQSAIVTICSHCTVLVDKCPDSEVADLAGCISEGCMELANALAVRPVETLLQSFERVVASLQYQGGVNGDENSLTVGEIRRAL